MAIVFIANEQMASIMSYTPRLLADILTSCLVNIEHQKFWSVFLFGFCFFFAFLFYFISFRRFVLQYCFNIENNTNNTLHKEQLNECEYQVNTEHQEEKKQTK